MSARMVGMNTLRACAIALALLLPAVARTADAPPASLPRPTADSKPPDELGEVLVTGEKPVNKVSELIPWLRRLPGTYSYEGYVDLNGKDDPDGRQKIYGVGECVGFGVAPGVQCEINVRWKEVRGPNGEEIPGGVSYFAPAMVLYGLEPDELGIRYLQVDNRGLAEGSTGVIVGDTASFRTPCVDMPEGCQRIVRVTAEPESKVIDMQIDTEVNFEMQTRFRFLLRRLPETLTQFR